ncbi:MAG TPA: TPM domain-containing protein [Pseudolabrys sp.]|nr:TPM domain-containing protein [Pseudolabrys sp.]
MSLSKEDHDRIASAIRYAEAKTSGEIVCVLAQTSSHATGLPIFLAAIAALALPWLLLTFPAMTVYRILLLQIMTFFILLVVLCLPRVRVALMPRRARRAFAYRVAMEQFASRGLASSRNQSGILIFVSLAERYARIIAGTEIAARVPQNSWQAAVDALIAHTRNGRVADGFISAIGICGDELARHFPRTDFSNNNFPDRIYLI